MAMTPKHFFISEKESKSNSFWVMKMDHVGATNEVFAMAKFNLFCIKM